MQITGLRLRADRLFVIMHMKELLWNGLTLESGSFPLGTDSVLLSQFAKLPSSARVADLGSGCGTLGLLLCATYADCQVVGVELDEQAHAAALENIAANGLQRLTSVSGDVREISALFPTGSFDCVVSNPPYFPVGSGKVSGKNPMARSEETLNLQQLCKAAAYLLPTGGRFFLVHRPERLCDLFCALRENGLEPKTIQFVRHRSDALPCLVLLEARRGGKCGLTYLPDFIEFMPDGTESEAYRAAYHRGESL